MASLLQSEIASKYHMTLCNGVVHLQISSMIEIEVEMDSDVLAAEAATNAVCTLERSFSTTFLSPNACKLHFSLFLNH